VGAEATLPALSCAARAVGLADAAAGTIADAHASATAEARPTRLADCGTSI
jgi:hypothetical protein